MSSEPDTIILYHAGCVDGFTAAWAIERSRRGSAVLQPVKYGEPMPEGLQGYRTVFVVDFSYPYADLVHLAATGTKVILLDHHQSAIDEISAAAPVVAGDVIRFGSPFVAELDPGRSGAGIAWDFVSSFRMRPPLVDYVEDRDLWRNALPGSREVSAYLRCLEHDLALWDQLARTPIDEIIELGKGATVQLDAVVRAGVEESYLCEMGGRRFPIANVTYLAGSETAEALCEHWDAPMAGYYLRQTDGRWKYGFRSRDGSMTVHDFAAQFGGGGHPSASGAVLDELAHVRVRKSRV